MEEEEVGHLRPQGEKKRQLASGTHLPRPGEYQMPENENVSLQGGHSVGCGHVQCENADWAMGETSV